MSTPAGFVTGSQVTTNPSGSSVESFAGNVRFGPVRDQVDEAVRADHLAAAGGLAPEAVLALRELLLELAERNLVEGRLAGLEEELGQPDLAHLPLRVQVDHRVAVLVEELEVPPLLAVGEQLQAGVLVGVVRLDVEVVRLELERLLGRRLAPATAATARRGDSGAHGRA